MFPITNIAPQALFLDLILVQTLAIFLPQKTTTQTGNQALSAHDKPKSRRSCCDHRLALFII
jgi:hypothetical protein